MNNIGEKYLPLGTVVLLEGGTKRVMITGFATASSDDPDLIYDYAGCMYPQGFITSNQTVLFDHDQIQKIYHFGLIDPEWVEFQDNLKKFLENLDEQDISAFGANINNTQVGVGPVGVNTNYNAMQANSINTGVGSLGFNQNFANSNPQANYINNTSAQSNSQFNGQNVTQSNLSQSNLNNMINNTNLNNNLQNTGVASNQINQNNVSGQS